MTRKGITSETIQRCLDKLTKEILADNESPDAAWMPKADLRKMATHGNLRADLQEILDDPNVPDNAVIQILRQSAELIGEE